MCKIKKFSWSGIICKALVLSVIFLGLSLGELLLKPSGDCDSACLLILLLSDSSVY